MGLESDPDSRQVNREYIGRMSCILTGRPPSAFPSFLATAIFIEQPNVKR